MTNDAGINVGPVDASSSCIVFLNSRDFKFQNFQLLEVEVDTKVKIQ